MRYRKLGYVALNVTDLPRSERFYRELLGLEPSGDLGPGTSAFRCSGQHHDVVLYRSPTPGLKRIGWELEDVRELARAREELARAGLDAMAVRQTDPDQAHQGPAFRVVEPSTGVLFEYYVAPARAATPFAPTVANIQRLGHVVLNVQRYDEAVRSLTGVFNFKVSDIVEDTATFMRCFPNPYHHSLAVARSDKTGLNHVNFMVSDIDDIGRALNRMQQADIPIVFGPGRHVPSGSIFLYFLDPDGITIEYSFGMEEFPEADSREPRMLARKLEVLDSWGGRPKPAMGAVGAIEAV